MSAQINLFNAELTQKKLTFSALMFSQILGLVLLIMVGMTWHMNRQTVKLEQQVDSSKAQLTASQAQLVKVTAENPPRTRSKLIEQRIGLLDAEIKSLLMAEQLLKQGNFGNAVGYSNYLAAIARQSQQGLWLTEVSIGEAGRSLGLRGRAVRAELVPQFIGRLATEPVMRGQSFNALELRRVTEEVALTSQPGTGSGTATGPVNGTSLPATLTAAGPPSQSGAPGEAGTGANANIGLGGVFGNLNLGPDVQRILNQLSGNSLTAAAPQQAAIATPTAPAPTRATPAAGAVPTVSSIEFSLQAHPPQGRDTKQGGK